MTPLQGAAKLPRHVHFRRRDFCWVVFKKMQPHECPEGQWYGYRAGSTTLLCDGSQPCACLPTPGDAPAYRPPCSPAGTCAGEGICLPGLSGVDVSRCQYNLDNVDLRFPSPLSLVPNKFCADVVTTNFTYSSVGNVDCWVLMESLAAPATEAILASFPPPFDFLGVAAEQTLLFTLWNTEGWGQKCTSLVDEITGKYGRWYPELNSCEQTEVYNRVLSECNDLGFRKSNEPQPMPTQCMPPQPPMPPDPPDPTVCDSEGQFCISQTPSGDHFHGHCAIDAGTTDLHCEPDPPPCQDKACGARCRNEAGLVGTCQVGEAADGASKNCDACTPLSLPLCSHLRDVASPPQGCEDKPLFNESAASPDRKACALLKDQKDVPIPQEAWQCHLQTPGCPTGTQECYWDGNWPGTAPR
jgi:hypothetical protein